MPKTKIGKPPLLAVIPLALVLVLGACGGSGSGGSGVASLDDGTGNQATSSDSGDDEVTPEEAEEAFTKYAECMREHGVDMPDPEVAGDGGGDGGVLTFRAGTGGPGGGNAESKAFEEAQDACGDLIEGVVNNGPRDLDP